MAGATPNLLDSASNLRAALLRGDFPRATSLLRLEMPSRA
jgi:hypothetical protein